MKNLKFSIITSFFNNNKKNYIKNIYESVINQTYDNWEWIITDDFSIDGTKDEILKLCNDKIRYVEQRYKREVFFNPQTYATGDIVVQLDSDDEMMPKALEVYNYFFNLYPDILFLSCNTNYYNENGEYIDNQYIYHGDSKNCLEKKSLKDINNNKNVNERNFLKINGGWGNLQAWRNIEIDFNPYNYSKLMYMDKIRAMCLEERGKYLHLPRTMFKNNFRRESISHRPLGDENRDDGMYMQRIKTRRKGIIESYVKIYDEIFVECLPLFYSKLNYEKDRKNISYFTFYDFNRKLLKELYFDHNLIFNEVRKEIDYYFFLIREVSDIQKVEDTLKNINSDNIIIFAAKRDFQKLEALNIKNDFNYLAYNNYFGFETLISKNPSIS